MLGYTGGGGGGRQETKFLGLCLTYLPISSMFSVLYI